MNLLYIQSMLSCITTPIIEEIICREVAYNAENIRLSYLEQLFLSSFILPLMLKVLFIFLYSFSSIWIKDAVWFPF